MTHDFSPIDTKAKYTAALGYLMKEGSKLAGRTIGQKLIPDTLVIFSQTDEEYAFLDRLIRTYGAQSRFTHGATLSIDVDMKVAGHPIVLLGVRQPDASRPEIGYADFSVSDYTHIRDTASPKYVHEVTSGRGESLLELKHPDFDIRGYVVPAHEHGTLFDELCHEVEQYHTKWHKFVAARQDKTFFEALKPTAVAWKVFDRAELDRCFADIRDMCDQVHFGWVNERWLGTLHLKDDVLPGGVQIIKLMERRPGSDDPIGLDHVDFMTPDASVAKALISKELNLKWSEETNGTHCKWLSLWFDGTEAKLRSDTVLQVCADELLEYQEHLTG